jgi:dephospho-CoA kinase
MVRKLIDAAETSRWVIDGIRNPAEVVELKKMADFILLGIQSEVPIILARLKQRGRSTDLIDEDEIRANLEREWGDGEPAEGQQVGSCLALADFAIANNGTLPELKTNLEAILKKIGAENV